MNKTLMTDFYELTMAQTYFNSNKHEKKAYFDIFFRKNPLDGGYGIMGGVDRIIDFIKNARFTNDDIEYSPNNNRNSEYILKLNSKIFNDTFEITNKKTNVKKTNKKLYFN